MGRFARNNIEFQNIDTCASYNSKYFLYDYFTIILLISIYIPGAKEHFTKLFADYAKRGDGSAFSIVFTLRARSVPAYRLMRELGSSILNIGDFLLLCWKMLGRLMPHDAATAAHAYDARSLRIPFAARSLQHFPAYFYGSKCFRISTAESCLMPYAVNVPIFHDIRFSSGYFFALIEYLMRSIATVQLFCSTHFTSMEAGKRRY